MLDSLRRKFACAVTRLLYKQLLKTSAKLQPYELAEVLNDAAAVETVLFSQLVSKLSPVQHEFLTKALLPFNATFEVGDVDHIANFSAISRRDWIRNKATKLLPGTRVLDAGAGEGQYREFFSHTNYKAQDFAQYKGNEAYLFSESWRYSKLDYECDITAIPVSDSEFDVVLCTEVLEHVPDPISALKELCRVLAPGGELFISAPLGSGVHQQPYHFYGGFSPYFYQKFLSDFGMHDICIEPLGGLMKHVAQESHRVGRVLAAAGDTSDSMRYLLMEWLPRFLFAQDKKHFVPEFTVGYVIVARKHT